MTVAHLSMPRWGPAVHIDTDQGYTIKRRGISDQQRSANVEHSRIHGILRGGELHRDDVDAHLDDDYGLQRPQACRGREFRTAGAGSLRFLGPTVPAGRADAGANANSQGLRG